MRLNILPPDSNRATIIPLMDKALTPYVKGGGAKKYEEELLKLYGMDDGTVQSKVGGFQAMTQDALTVLQDVPFSIPPYFAILGRAIVTLEGVALSGNPDYGIIMEAYPFIARRLMKEGRPEIQKALQEVLYTSNDGDGNGLKLSRLLTLLNNAAGAVATQEGAAFVDLDTVPDNGLSLKEGIKFVLSDDAVSLRTLLEKEVDNGVDVVTRQIIRRAVSEAVVALTPPRPPSLPFLGDLFPTPPALDEIPMPLLLPNIDENIVNRPSVSLLSIREFTDLVAPALSQDEEVFAISLADFVGGDVGALLKGDRVLSAQTGGLILRAIRSGALARVDLLDRNSETTQALLQFIENAWNVLRGISSSAVSSLEADFYAAIDALTETERTMLDSIVDELLQRSIRRAAGRLSNVERIL
jgi:aarF domain-containing kinase